MRDFVRWLTRLGLMFTAIAAGCGGGGGFRSLYGVDLLPLYGPPVTPEPHDPAVELEELSYQPAGLIEPGTTLEFTVTASRATEAGYILVHVGDPPQYDIALQDLGEAPDAVAGDGSWARRWQVPADAPPGTYELSAELKWDDGYGGDELPGPPLEITEEEPE